MLLGGKMYRFSGYQPYLKFMKPTKICPACDGTSVRTTVLKSITMPFLIQSHSIVSFSDHFRGSIASTARSYSEEPLDRKSKLLEN